MGVVQGIMIKNRMSHFARNSRIKASARMFESTSTRPIEAKVKTAVFRRDFRNTGSPTSSTKFLNPTILKSGFPTVTLLRLYTKAMMSGKPTSRTTYATTGRSSTGASIFCWSRWRLRITISRCQFLALAPVAASKRLMSRIRTAKSYSAPSAIEPRNERLDMAFEEPMVP